MPRWAAKTDDNHQLIMDAFRNLGFSVKDTSRLGQGFPDLVIGKHGINTLIEVKDGSKPPSARKLTKDERAFYDTWKGDVDIVESTDDVIRVAKKIKILSYA